jgi:hypothetical protein
MGEACSEQRRERGPGGGPQGRGADPACLEPEILKQENGKVEKVAKVRVSSPSPSKVSCLGLCVCVCVCVCRSFQEGVDTLTQHPLDFKLGMEPRALSLQSACFPMELHPSPSSLCSTQEGSSPGHFFSSRRCPRSPESQPREHKTTLRKKKNRGGT